MAERTSTLHDYGEPEMTRRWDGLRCASVRWDVAAESEAWARQPEHLLMVTLSGSLRTAAETEGERRYEGTDFAGATTLVPATRRRWTRHGAGSLSYAVIWLDPAHLHAMDGADGLGDTGRIELTAFTNRPDPFVGQVARALVGEPRPADRLFADALATALTLHLVRNYSTVAPARPRERPALTGRPLRDVLDHVHAHLGDDLRLAVLARLAGMDRHRFGHAFKAATGSSPHRYVMERRLEAAARLLRERPDMPIADIAYGVGMSSQSHLTTAFRRRYGTTPRAYRREVRA
ncbi:AraC family transcriptional regulator [Spirillospora sp. NPDC047279]|uniref:AraC family transcriptional regulator n=1 Tax=Spirillospora sp. NPDC047279 TaxID=3155478 RepID=UPI0033D642AD